MQRSLKRCKFKRDIFYNDVRKALCRQLLLSYGTEQALRVARRTHESSKKFSQCWEYLFTLVYIESMEKQGGSRNMNLSADEYEVIKKLTLLKTHDVLADINSLSE